MHDEWWAAVCKARGDRDGTRALIEVLLLARHMQHEHIVAGLAAALRAGALTADAVALEARKAAEADQDADQATVQAVGASHEPEHAELGGPAPVTSLTQRRLAQLPPDTRPLPSVAVYDQLLRRNRPPDRPTSEGEMP